MAWSTWWALVLGFSIAGIVETFVSERRLSRLLGGRSFRAVSLGTVFGAASSSCSFGAVATAKALFKKGASAEASLAAFQFASTNLVIELGLVMWVLLGWEFVIADALAGLILIALLVLCFRFIVPDSLIEDARKHVRGSDDTRCPTCGMEVDPRDALSAEINGETHYFCSQGCMKHFQANPRTEESTPSFRSREGWARGAANALKEWRMLWKDIVIGFIAAGLIGAFVPREWWATLFSIIGGETFLGIVFACCVGVLIGVATFVCSVGNVPFALILWKNGAPFGAVMAFIFSDLIVPHIIDSYRRYYGARMAFTFSLLIAACSVVAGVIIHYVWDALSLIPPANELGGTAPDNYTLYLNVLFT
ncbi:MAG: permease, partial [Bdellovibrionales bacterium]|nr:permease [Bdellovibrionales bacterium]